MEQQQKNNLRCWQPSSQSKFKISNWLSTTYYVKTINNNNNNNNNRAIITKTIIIIIIIECFLNECRKTKTKVITSSQPQQTQITQWTNQNSKQMHVTGTERGKTRASELGLVWVLLLIAQESGATFFNQSQSKVKQNQSKTQITFDGQLKTALITTTTYHCNHLACSCWLQKPERNSSLFHYYVFYLVATRMP